MGLLGECLYILSCDTEAEPFLRAALNSARASPFPLLPWQMAEVQSAVGAGRAEKKSYGLHLVRSR